MKHKLYLLAAAAIMFCARTYAQQPPPGVPVTETQPAMVNGLQMGYTIKSEETKKVGDKGDFSRYAMRFYVTNTLPEAKIILYKQGWNVFGNVSDQLAQFNCLNATGARLTSKFITISAAPCNVLAKVNNGGKEDKQFVQIGYWIKPGETISADCIMIVPLNEKPDVEAVYLAGISQPAANASFAGPAKGPAMPPPDPVQTDDLPLARIKNLQSNTYINNQNGPVVASSIDMGWWSAQWQLIPVPGTQYYGVQNRWRKNYLAADNTGVTLIGNYMLNGGRWLVEPCRQGAAFRLRNVDYGGYLCIASNQLTLAKNYNNVFTAEWEMEQP